jgi:oxygen-dependent protoporphyrinogen oxidase
MGIPLLLVERGPRWGGVIDTIERYGFLFDIGPQSFLANEALNKLITELGLAAEVVRADPQAPRYIFHKRHLVPAPLDPKSLLRTPLVGWATKRRLVAEPLGRSHPPEGDESVAAFVRRKFGEDLLNNLVAPFVSGVFAGDPERLSLVSAFPAVRRLEEQYSSVLRGAMKSRGAEGPARPSLCNFRRGLVTLTHSLAAKLDGSARSGTEAVMIRRDAAGESPGFAVALSNEARIEPLKVSAIVVATPTDQAARLLAGIDRQFDDAFAPVEYAPVVQVSAGYRMADISESELLRKGGFGFLVARGEGLRLLGTVWSSLLFPGRAPAESENMVSLTSFLGGATDPEICALTESELGDRAHEELSRVLGIQKAPVVQHVSRWENALPQYNLGHADIVRRLDELCAGAPGLFLAGNYLAGPSLGACVEQANKIAEKVAQFCQREN